MKLSTIATLFVTASLAYAKIDAHLREQSSLFELFRRHSLPDDYSLGIDVDARHAAPAKPKSSEKVHLKHVTTAQIIARRAARGRKLAARASSIPPTLVSQLPRLLQLSAAY